MPSRFLVCMQRAQFSAEDTPAREHNPNAVKEMKFNAFNKPDGIQKDYSVKDEWKRRVSAHTPTKFEAKKEFSIRPFDPHIRHRIDTIDNGLIYRGIEQAPPQKDAQSCYVAI